MIDFNGNFHAINRKDDMKSKFDKWLDEVNPYGVGMIVAVIGAVLAMGLLCAICLLTAR